MNAQLGDLRKFNDERAWLEWYGMAKACLRTTDRGGQKGGKHKSERACRERIKAWLGGDRAWLWTDRKKPVTDKSKTDTAGKGDPSSALEASQGPGGNEGTQAKDRETRHARAVELAKEGMFGRSCSALIALPPVEVTDAVIEEMKAKHPKAREEGKQHEASLREVSAGAAPKIGDDAMRAALKSFPKGSGGVCLGNAPATP